MRNTIDRLFGYYTIKQLRDYLQNPNLAPSDRKQALNITRILASNRRVVVINIVFISLLIVDIILRILRY